MKKNKVINHRQCIISKKRMGKEDLIRFVIINKHALIDQDQKIKARGYYISKTLNWNDIKKKHHIINQISNYEEFLEQVSKALVKE